MTTSTIQPQNGDATQLANIDAAPQGPEWFQPTRQKAIDCFAKLGLPTSRHEDWRFTNIAPIREQSFTLGDHHASTPDIGPAQIPGLTGPQLVFINGRLDQSLSDISKLPEGIEVIPLTEAFESHSSLLKDHFAKLATYEDQAFTALNTALATEGTVIIVQKGKTIDDPIHLLNVAAGSGASVLTNPRNLIIAEDSASVTVIEDYVSLTDRTHLTNSVTEVFVGDNASVTHYLLERENQQSFNVSSLFSTQGRDSRFTSHSVLLGGAIVRNNVNPILNGEGCDSLLNGLYVIGDRQAVDNHMRVEHAKPHGDSRQFYKGIMSDSAKGVFRGRIVVRQEAQKTDAKQSNQNLLLSDNASINTDPQLEIYADDVKCTHGATIGQLDEEQLFYLRSRGIPEETARAMIIYAFASETLERMDIQPVRRYLAAQLLSRLPAGKVLEKTL